MVEATPTFTLGLVLYKVMQLRESGLIEKKCTSIQNTRDLSTKFVDSFYPVFIQYNFQGFKIHNDIFLNLTKCTIHTRV